MKHLLVVIAFALSTLPALADGNGGPQSPNSAFLIWQKQASDGAAFTSHEALTNQANRETAVASGQPKTQTN